MTTVPFVVVTFAQSTTFTHSEGEDAELLRTTHAACHLLRRLESVNIYINVWIAAGVPCCSLLYWAFGSMFGSRSVPPFRHAYVKNLPRFLDAKDKQQSLAVHTLV